MNSEFFSGSNPSLINNKLLREFNKRLDLPPPPEDTVITSAHSFYKDYVEANLFPLIVILLMALYLFIMYVIKQDKDRERKQKQKEESFIDMKPHVPVSRQTNHSRYLPDEIKGVKLGDKYYSHRDIYGDYSELDDELISDDYSIDNNNHTATDDTWSDDEDSQMDNIYGYPHDYISSTAEAMGFAADKNRKNLDDLTRIVFGEDRKLKRNTGYDM
jgi:hypothetical protein